MDHAEALEASFMTSQHDIDAAAASGDSEVQRFYSGATVFITGGTGFLGKQLVEKLIRSCNLSKIYMLMRSKKGMQIQERLDEMFKETVFDSALQHKPNFKEIIVPVEGDVAEIRLGIKDEDWKTLTEEVNVIFHVAATTKFDETLRLATLINVRGTREALLFGKACKQLRSYVHVSTAYTHATTKFVDQEIEEEFYPSPVKPETMISMAENMDSERLDNITNDLIKNWPNTYTFTKSISEELVRTASAGLPICIVRPGIVLCTHREPVPGWLDTSCVYGASGVVFGVALGVLHAIQSDGKTKLGMIPCDYVNNAVIVAGREASMSQAKGGNNTRIYSLTMTHRNPVSWEKLGMVLNSEGRKLSSPEAVYFCYAIQTCNKLLYMLASLFLHIIPAYIADSVCLLMGKKRWFVKTAKKVYRMCNMLSYFLVNEWLFIDNNTEKLYNSLSETDKVVFNFDVKDLDWDKFPLLWCVGVRKYLIKDGLKNTDYAVKKQFYFKILHYFILAVYFYGIWKLVYFAFYIVTNVILLLSQGLVKIV